MCVQQHPVQISLFLWNIRYKYVRRLQASSFIHFGYSYSSPSSTTQRRSQLQHGYCIGVSRRSAQAIVGKGLAQGPYVVARAGVEPTTLQLKVIDSTNAPPRPTWKWW